MGQPSVFLLHFHTFTFVVRYFLIFVLCHLKFSFVLRLGFFVRKVHLDVFVVSFIDVFIFILVNGYVM